MARILLADDDRNLADLWQEALQDAGHAVTLTHTGLQTVAALKDAEYDVLITDINMPDGGGFLVTQEVGQINNDIPIIVVTGNPTLLSTGTFAKRPGLGPDEVAVKPIELGRLVSLVDAAIKSRPRRGLAERLSALFSSARGRLTGS